jgi:hypothetical protein
MATENNFEGCYVAVSDLQQLEVDFESFIKPFFTNTEEGARLEFVGVDEAATKRDLVARKIVEFEIEYELSPRLSTEQEDLKSQVDRNFPDLDIIIGGFRWNRVIEVQKVLLKLNERTIDANGYEYLRRMADFLMPLEIE